jgi:type I restriction enzyme, S subunit
VRDGTVPAGWRLARVGEIARIEIGRTPSRNRPEFWDRAKLTGNRWVSIADMQGRFISETTEHISDLGVKESGAKLVPAGTPLMSFKLTVGRVSIPTVAVYTNEAIAAFHVAPEADRDFLAYALPRAALGGPSDRAVKGLTLNTAKLKRLLILLPPLPEQHKMAEFLSSVDEAIEKTEAVIEQVRRVKQGLAKQLLTRGLPGRHTRFKQTEVGEIAEEWEVVRIQDLASDEPRSIQSGPFGSSLRHSEFQDTGVLVIGIDNVLDGRFSMGSQHRISYQKFEELRQYEARPLDVLITVMATVGRSCLVPPDLERAIITKHVYRITVNRSKCDPRFPMWCFLYSPIVLNQLYGAAQGQTRPGLNGRLIKRVRLPLPRLDEQTEIGELLARMDARIDREEIALRALQHMKSALTHVLLTGQVRVMAPASPVARGEEQG